MSLAALLAALVPLAWLVPNHYLPWMSAWSEGWALALTGAAALALADRPRLPAALLGFAALAAASVVVQWVTGRLFFGGDAVVVLLFLAALLAAVAAGSAAGAADALAMGTLAAAALSVGVALAQWLGHPALPLFGLRLPAGARPFANLGQPNLLASALFLGVCAAAVLHERGRIGRVGLVAAWVWLALGVTMTGSRTGWLQALLLVAFAVAWRRRAALRVTPAAVLAYAALLALLWFAWAWADAALSAGTHVRSVQDQMAPGVRLPYWRAMLDAVAREPWAGHGWNQTALAQWVVAPDHAPLQRHFEQAHNLVLELLLWAGVPVGTALVLLAAWVLLRPLAACRDGAALWLLAGVAGLALHAMVEYPLYFAHLLLPAGLFLGAALARTGVQPLPPRALPALRAAALAFAVALGFVARDYLEAEQNNRVLLLELGRIGTARVESAPPDLPWLTQLGAFLSFVRTEPRAGMRDAELEAMRRVALRFAYAPSLARWAEALALNGRTAQAGDVLRQLCRIHPPARCAAARERWDERRAQQPALPPWPAPG